MKSLLVTAVVTTFALALFLHSGNTLVCYNCYSANCKITTTCKDGQDTCIVVYHGEENLSGCWRYEDCNANYVSTALSLMNIKTSCCTWDLCNNAPKVVGSKIVLSGALLLTIVYMLKSLV